MTTASRSLMTGSATLIAGQATQALVAFGANLVLVAYIAPADFGRFALIFATASLVLSILSLRVNTLIIRARPEDFTSDHQSLYFTALTFETTVATAVGILWTVAAGFSEPWAVILVCAIGARHWVEQNKAFFERSMPYMRLGLMETGVSLAAHVASVVMVLVGLGPEALYWREVLLLVFGLGGLLYLRGLTWRRLRWLSLVEWRAIVREARGVWLDSTLEAVYQRLVIQLAGVFGGDKGAGYFFQAQRLAALPHLLLTPLVGRIVGNWFARAETPLRRRHGRDRVLLVLVGPLLAGAGVAFFFADPIVPWLFGEPWQPSAPLFAGMCGVILFMSLFEVLRAYCVIIRRTRLLLAGRILQYGILGGILAVTTVAGMDPSVKTLSVAVSFGLAVSFVFLWMFLVLSERRSA
jgi:O-antigen/teichoic acid export membrane protein